MKKSRFTETQIVSTLNEADAFDGDLTLVVLEAVETGKAGEPC